MQTGGASRLGALIRRLREERKWSQGQLAYHAKVSRSWITQMEAGSYASRPSTAHVMRLAQALGQNAMDWFRILGYGLGDLLREQPEAFAPEVIEAAANLQQLHPEHRAFVLDLLRRLIAREQEAQSRHEATATKSVIIGIASTTGKEPDLDAPETQAVINRAVEETRPPIQRIEPTRRVEPSDSDRGETNGMEI